MNKNPPKGCGGFATKNPKHHTRHLLPGLGPGGHSRGKIKEEKDWEERPGERPPSNK